MDSEQEKSKEQNTWSLVKRAKSFTHAFRGIKILSFVVKSPLIFILSHWIYVLGFEA